MRKRYLFYSFYNVMKFFKIFDLHREKINYQI